MKNNPKSISRNTFYLYIRMMVTMIVTLYTSRIVLEALGVINYGIYQTVGGIVGLLAFLNGALSSGSSRFLTFELGKGITDKLRSTFSTLLVIHICLAIFIVIFGEFVGVWFIRNRLILPDNKIADALFVFHISILTSVFSMTQVPYTSVIIAHEQLTVYAYISIVDAILKLIVAYFIKISTNNTLRLYALLLCIIQIIVMFFYRFYCIRHYEESKFLKNKINLKILKEVGAFSSWSLFASISIALTAQGTLILLNNFFSPVVVSARTIALQVNTAANQFVQNFRTAANPQIVKKYSNSDFDGSKKLLLESTYFSYYLILIIGIPVILLAEPFLKFWLGIIPEYSVPFLQWGIIQSLFSVFDTSFYTALYAKGQLKENALLSPIIALIQFPLAFIFFKLGYSPMIICYLGTFVYAVLGCLVKPILLCKIVQYKFREFFILFLRCFLVTIISIPLPLLSTYLIDKNTVSGFIIIGFISILSVLVSVFFIGLKIEMRNNIINKICIVFKNIYKYILEKGKKR